MVCGVFWDVEQCPVPAGMHTAVGVSTLKMRLQCLGPLKKFVAYGRGLADHQRSGFHGSGVELRSERMDLIVDMLFFAMEHQQPNATVVVVSGSPEMQVLTRLRDHRFTVVVVAPQHKVVSFTHQFQVMAWEGIFEYLTGPVALEPLYPQPTPGTSSQGSPILSHSEFPSAPPQPSPEFVREFMDALYAWVLAQPDGKVNTVGLKPFYDKHPNLAERPKTFKLKREVQTHGDSRLTFIDGPPGSQWIVAAPSPRHRAASNSTSSVSSSLGGSSTTSRASSWMGAAFMTSLRRVTPPEEPLTPDDDDTAKRTNSRDSDTSSLCTPEQLIPTTTFPSHRSRMPGPIPMPQQSLTGYEIGDIIEAKYESPRRWSRATVVGGPSEKNYEMWQTVKFWDTDTNTFREENVELPITKMRFVTTKKTRTCAHVENHEVYYECEFECGFEDVNEDVVALHERHCPRRPAVGGARVKPIPAPPDVNDSTSFLNRDSPVARLLRHTFRSFLGSFDDGDHHQE